MSIKDEKGYTLVELLLAVAVLGVIMVPFFGMFSAGNFNNFQAGNYSTAVNLAREKMESIKNTEYDSVEALGAEAVDGYPSFSRVVDVTEHEAVETDEVELKEVTVTVYWDDRSYGLSSYITRR